MKQESLLFSDEEVVVSYQSSIFSLPGIPGANPGGLASPWLTTCSCRPSPVASLSLAQSRPTPAPQQFEVWLGARYKVDQLREDSL